MAEKFVAKVSLPEIVRNDFNLYEGDLVHYFQVIVKHAQNLNHPYHNFRHMMHVTYMCYQACLFYKEHMSKREMRILLIAAMFHDFDHRGMLGDDDLNIERALRGLKSFITENDRVLFDKIALIIKATEYPHVLPTEKLNLSCKIIRDADLSGVMSNVWVQQIMFGFAGEWGRTPLEVLRSQVAFIDRLDFKTEWARIMFPRHEVQAKIEETKELLELIEVGRRPVIG